MVNRTDIQCDIEKAKEEAYRILEISRMSFEELLKGRGYQLSLVNRKGVKDLRDGVYTHGDKRNKVKTSEEDYTEFNEDFKSYYLYQIYRILQKTTNNRVGRFRLMWLNPGNCYLFHTDENEPDRFHLALETNPYCLFMYRDSSNEHSTYHVPVDGYVYSVNAGEKHTFLNAGKTTRLHILVTLMDPKYVKV